MYGINTFFTLGFNEKKKTVTKCVHIFCQKWKKIYTTKNLRKIACFQHFIFVARSGLKKILHNPVQKFDKVTKATKKCKSTSNIMDILILLTPEC